MDVAGLVAASMDVAGLVAASMDVAGLVAASMDVAGPLFKIRFLQDCPWLVSVCLIISSLFLPIWLLKAWSLLVS
jgi:hypothetical protein